MSRHFVSIHTHSTFSIMDATSQPHRMSRRIAELGQKGFFLTDHGNMNGFSEIQKAAAEAGVVCVPGIESYVAIKGHLDKTERDTAHLTVWAYNLEGYRNLCRLQTKSFVDGFYFDPRVDLEMLEDHSEGLMAASGCLGGIINKPLTAGNRKEAERRVKLLSEIFEDRFWIEIQNHKIEEELANHVALTSIAQKFHLPMVAAHDSHYTDIEDYIPHDVVVCLRSGKQVDDPNRKLAYEPKEFHLKSVDEMLKRHKPEHVYESGRIFDMCEAIDITTKQFHIPKLFSSPNDKLRELTMKGAKDRYPRSTKENGDRLKYELDAICKAGFAPYILLIADIMQFARDQGIPVGAGRGSAAGSAVCYCLGITDIDPLKYDLMFERFIDPNRVSQPDIDLDFSATHRQEVIQYIKDKYGEDKVSQILTFQTMGGKAALKDVARALGKPYELGTKLADLIPKEGSVTRDREERNYIQNTLDSVKEFARIYNENDGAKEVVDLAVSLEGQLKATSLHAAGVVVADKPLGEYCPMVTVAGDSKGPRLLATGYTMNELEDIGLLKVDILGIRYLDVLNEAIESAKAAKELPKNFSSQDIDVDDDSIYRILSAGNTAGIFQVEGGGLTKLLRDFKPKQFGDIALSIAIFRPGPISQIPDLVRRANGIDETTYPHKLLKPILKDTYGLVIYQEQIVRMAVAIAGYDLTRADGLRKVIAKKIVEKMDAEKSDFIDAAVKEGHKRQWAEDLFTDLIEPAARYAFGKSHAYSYADLTARTAWMKANHPVHYYAALLKSIEDHPSRDERMSSYIADAREMGIAILPPDINKSGKSFTAIPSEKAVLFGLNGIKYVPTKAVDEIIKERKNGDFTEFFSTIERIKSTHCNSRAIEALTASGALDGMAGNRASKLNSLEAAFTRADCIKEDHKRVDAGGVPTKRKKPIPEAVLIEVVDDKVKLLSQERELIGWYLSSHPYLDVKDSIDAATVQQAREQSGDVTVGGIVSRLKEHTTKKSKAKMLFGAIEDDRAVLEFVVFPRQYDSVKALIKLDMPVILSGRIEHEGDDDESSMAKLIVQGVSPVGRGIKRSRKPIMEKTLRLDSKKYREQLELLAEELADRETVACIEIILPDESIVKLIA